MEGRKNHYLDQVEQKHHTQQTNREEVDGLRVFLEILPPRVVVNKTIYIYIHTIPMSLLANYRAIDRVTSSFATRIHVHITVAIGLNWASPGCYSYPDTYNYAIVCNTQPLRHR